MHDQGNIAVSQGLWLFGFYTGECAHGVNADNLPVPFVFGEVVVGGLIQNFFVLCIETRKIHFNERSILALAENFDSFDCRVLPATFLQAFDVDDGYVFILNDH